MGAVSHRPRRTVPGVGIVVQIDRKYFKRAVPGPSLVPVRAEQTKKTKTV